ncbi:MAG: hypothetical protein H6711_33985 [Myxococcales bacterium]|nr:hypothetical protein [Myxococcales bacterium]
MTRKTLLLPLLFLFGCSIHSQLNKIEDEAQESVDIICECNFPTPDGSPCEDYFSSDPFAALDRDCVEDALAIDKKASKELLDCQLDVMKTYNKCLRDNLDCADPNSSVSCADIFNDFGACPQLPGEVQTEFGKCGNNNG